MRTAKYLGLLCSLSLVSTATTAAHAQDRTIDGVLSGREVPLTMPAKQLTGDYKRLVIKDSNGIASLQNMMIEAKSGVELGLYFSKGETVSTGGETYLIAYRPQFDVDIAGIINHHGHGDDDAPTQSRKLRPNMTLSLSLLNLRTNSRMDDIRSFDAKRDLESPQESSEASLRNLRGLGTGMMTYLRGRGRGVMPQIGTSVSPAVRRTFYPFVHDQNLWIQPATEEPYLPNPRISGINVNRVANTKFLVAFYEATPGSDGLRGVVYLDGHVERVAPQRWTRLQAAKVVARPGVKSVYANPNAGATTVVVESDEIDAE